MHAPTHTHFLQPHAVRCTSVVHTNASQGDTCQRYAFASRMRFTSGGWPYIDFEGGGARRAAAPPVEQTGPSGAGGCRIVAPCDALADEPELRVGAPVSCEGRPCRRLGERDEDDDTVVPVCSVAVE